MPCQGCNRDFVERPNALCSSVLHWRAYAEELETKLSLKYQESDYDAHGFLQHLDED